MRSGNLGTMTWNATDGVHSCSTVRLFGRRRRRDISNVNLCSALAALHTLPRVLRRRTSMTTPLTFRRVYRRCDVSIKFSQWTASRCSVLLGSTEVIPTLPCCRSVARYSRCASESGVFTFVLRSQSQKTSVDSLTRLIRRRSEVQGLSLQRLINT